MYAASQSFGYVRDKSFPIMTKKWDWLEEMDIA